MKKIYLFLSLLTILSFSSCTEQMMVRGLGGKMEIEVPAGYKVTSATWKEAELFYFLEPMEDDYVPKEKKFVESSSYGILESEVTFKEKR
jgi:hypothetical protein